MRTSMLPSLGLYKGTHLCCFSVVADNLCQVHYCWVLTSARVGVGFPIMDSSMLVATMTGLPRFRQPCTILLCQYGTCMPI